MNRKVFLSLLVIILLTVGCASAATPAPQASRGLAPGAMPPAQPQAPETFGQADTGNQPQAANVAGAERMIVYSGQLSLVVKDARAAVDEITQIVQSAGGFVTASSTYEDAGYTRATMTVRIPGEDLAQLKATLSKVKGLALQVEKEDLNGQDVTDQYTDNQAEIDNLTAQRDSYRKLLDRATKMEDILSIQARLDDVQGRINRLTGQQLKLKENVKLATVNITLTPDALAQPVRIGNWRPEGTARDALQALFWALQTIGKTLIWTVICVLPIGLLLGVPTFLVVRFARSRRRRKATPVPPQT